MRTDKLYLNDIVEAADNIAQILSGASREEFMDSLTLRSAAMYQLENIGEAAARVSGEMRGRHTEIEWSDIVGFRNIAVHAYFAVDWSISWSAATRNAPVLREQVAQILAEEFPDAETDD